MLVRTEPVSLAPASPEEAAAVERVLADRYGIVTDAVSRYEEKTTSAVFRCAVPGGDPVVAKRSGWTDDLVAVRESCKLGERLRARGVALPEVMRTTDGDHVARDGDETYMVLSHLPGEHFSSRPEEWASAGAALGKFHAAGLAVLRDDPSVAEAIARDIPVEMPYEESREMYLSGLRETLLAAHECAFPKVCSAFRDSVGMLEAAMESVDSAFLGCAPVFGIVHNDFHTNNGLYLEDGSFSGFLDMDQVGVGPLVWDVGNTLFSFASNALAKGNEDRIRDLSAGFVAAYHRENPLPVGDYGLVLAAGMRWDLMRVLRSMRRHRFENDRFPGNIRKIEERLLGRIRQAPGMFAWMDEGWFAAVLPK